MGISTEILKSDNYGIAKAAKLLASGEIVGIPTETVYGLAADAKNEEAVKKIFIAKGRPQDNPLIVHISSMDMLSSYVSKIPQPVYKLAEKFWPGPLTMIMAKSRLIPMVTSGGLDTVGIRMPSHKTALKIINKCGFALAAPSANLSGSPSPTTANHVLDDMNGKIYAVVDGGECLVGVESTVISFDNDETVRILRPGYISYEDLKMVIPNVIADKGILGKLDSNEKVLSPGMKYTHYSPKAKVVIVESNLSDFIDYVKNNSSSNTYSMIFNDDAKHFPFPYLTYGNTSEEQAHEIFDKLREFDKIGAETVYTRCPSKNGVGMAVYNRLLRAAGFEVIKL